MKDQTLIVPVDVTIDQWRIPTLYSVLINPISNSHQSINQSTQYPQIKHKKKKMHIPTISQLALSASTLISTPNITPNPSLSKPSPGYSRHTPSTVNNNSFDFGQNFAVLNLDLINGLVGGVNGTKEGKKWVQCTEDWIDAYFLPSPTIPTPYMLKSRQSAQSQTPTINSLHPYLLHHPLATRTPTPRPLRIRCRTTRQRDRIKFQIAGV